MDSTSPVRHRMLWVSRRRTLWASAAALALLVWASGCGSDETGTFTLEPVNYSGVDPFMSSVGTDQTGVESPPGSGGTVAGDTAGLYGGTRDESSCDPQKLVDYLAGDPQKAAAWAGVLGIDANDIASYVSTLTSVNLRTDTMVTNHGYEDGHATSMSSVLEAGTAVLVDQHGAPVTKCYCGNPLTAPSHYERPTFTGAAWPSFSVDLVSVVTSVDVVIDQFVLVQSDENNAFTRPTGSRGDQDGEPQPLPSTSLSPTPSGSSSATTTDPQATGTATTDPGSHTGTTDPSTSTAAPPAPTTTAIASAARAVRCVVDQGGVNAVFKAGVAIHNNDASDSHSYQATVRFAGHGTATATVPNVAGGDTGQDEVSISEATDQARALPAGPTDCAITELVDENGDTVPEQGSVTPPARPDYIGRATPDRTAQPTPTPS